MLNSNFPARASRTPGSPPPPGAPAHISLLRRTGPQRTDDNSNRTPGSSKRPGRPARQAGGGRAQGSGSPAPGSARPRRSPPPPMAPPPRAELAPAAPPPPPPAALSALGSDTTPGSLRLRAPEGLPAGRHRPGMARTGRRRRLLRGRERGGRLGPARAASRRERRGTGRGGKEPLPARGGSRFPPARPGSAPRRSCRAVPAVPCAARAPPGGAALTCPGIRPRPAPLPAPPRAGSTRWRRFRERPRRARRGGAGAVRPPPPRRRPRRAPPRPPPARGPTPRVAPLVTFGARLRGAPPPAGPARPRAARSRRGWGCWRRWAPARRGCSSTRRCCTRWRGRGSPAVAGPGSTASMRSCCSGRCRCGGASAG